ncbi:MAG TPA: ABC transporter permease [Candidatus Saccharimonadaceae bacterium]|nr:ABC transporter permease [Candidatus Saccharimonadaceae bacterium]
MTLPAPRGPGAAPALALVASGVLVVVLALPFVGLLARVTPRLLVERLGDPGVRDALALSLATGFLATALVVVLGAPLAYLLATRSFPGKRAIEVLVDLPMVLPPTVAGFALLMAFGRAGLVGRALGAFGVSLPFTTAAVVLAQAFMAAPFFVGAARAGFAGVDPRLTEAAATLGVSETERFRRVVLPLVRPSLVAGIAMSGARALGEFGATITFAGNLAGTTRTLPLAVYVALQSDLDLGVVLSVLLLVASLLLLLALRAAPAGWLGGSRPAVARAPQAAR